MDVRGIGHERRQLPAPVGRLTAPVGRLAAPLREQVSTALREAIQTLELKPGQRLIERELMEQLQVSRPTVREALRELASEGLVTVIPQRGTVVSTLSGDDARDLYDVRASLESLVVRRFVQRASNELIDDVDMAVERYAAAAREHPDDVVGALRVKDEFYVVLLEGAASEVLKVLLDQLQARIQQLRARSMAHAGRLAESARELQAIAEAIRRRDEEEAARLCAQHIWTAARTALSHFEVEEPQSASPQ